jgi:hypothetical protein
MRELRAAGFEAKQCYQISEASYRSAKSAPARLFLRFRQYVLYPMMLCIRLLELFLGTGKEIALSLASVQSDSQPMDPERLYMGTAESVSSRVSHHRKHCPVKDLQWESLKC